MADVYFQDLGFLNVQAIFSPQAGELQIDVLDATGLIKNYVTGNPGNNTLYFDIDNCNQ